ncbi:MAG: hypothetical protein JST68_22275 [Bacteroidetes bacterium]|nr:hypothetical protein [Bacteroidota bacterium]
MEKNQQHQPDPQHPPNKGNENARQPDPETLGTTDPPEHMKGPISSIVQKVREEVEKNNAEAPEESEEPKKD